MLGAATSGVTLFRGIGGSLGAAVFGTIFSSRLAGELRRLVQWPLAHQVASGGRLTGAQVARLPSAAALAYEHAYVHALSPVFLAASGVALLGFVLAWLLPERPLRESRRHQPGPRRRPCGAAIAGLPGRDRAGADARPAPEERAALRERLAERAGVELIAGRHVGARPDQEHGLARARHLADADGVPPERITQVTQELRGLGLLAREAAALESDGGGQGALTPTGRDHAERLLGARRELLVEALADDGAERDPQVLSLLRRLAVELCGEPPGVQGPVAA